MNDSRYKEILNHYNEALEKLRRISTETNSRADNKNQNLFDEFFYENINFFMRNYMIMLCTYLESYLTDIAKEIFEKHCNQINGYGLPKRFIYSNIYSFNDENIRGIRADEKFIINSTEAIKNFLGQTRISGNVGKTIHAFEILGIDLATAFSDVSIKERISTIVNIRNGIIHRNDDATTITHRDINEYIDLVKEYISNIHRKINS